MTERIGITWRGEDVGEILVDCSPRGSVARVRLEVTAKEPRRLARLAIFENSEAVVVEGGTVPASLGDDVPGILAALQALNDRESEFVATVPEELEEAAPDDDAFLDGSTR